MERYLEPDLVFNHNSPEVDVEVTLKCPVCGCSYVHADRAYALRGTDECESFEGTGRLVPQGSSGDRRGAIVLRFFGECGHRFELNFRQHKGITMFDVIRLKGLSQIQYRDLVEQITAPQ